MSKDSGSSKGQDYAKEKEEEIKHDADTQRMESAGNGGKASK